MTEGFADFVDFTGFAFLAGWAVFLGALMGFVAFLGAFLVGFVAFFGAFLVGFAIFFTGFATFFGAFFITFFAVFLANLATFFGAFLVAGLVTFFATFLAGVAVFLGAFLTSVFDFAIGREVLIGDFFFFAAMRNIIGRGREANGWASGNQAFSYLLWQRHGTITHFIGRSLYFFVITWCESFPAHDGHCASRLLGESRTRADFHVGLLRENLAL